MSSVDSEIMEAFGRGIQACMNEDWYTFARALKETGFVTDPVEYRSDIRLKFKPFGVDKKTGEDLGLEQFTKELAQAMTSTEGGTSRFGAAPAQATSLGSSRLSPRTNGRRSSRAPT